MKRASRAMKCVAAALSVVMFFTNVLFLHAAETVWKDRQKAKDIQLAALPAAAGLQFGPATNRIPLINPVNPTFKQLSKDIPKGMETKYAPVLMALSNSYGTVRKISTPKTNVSNSPIVIHIQDVHLNPEAQGNIAKTVQELINQKKVGLVALEGVFAPIDFSVFRKFPHQEAVKTVADYLLEEKKISGAVHAAFTSPVQIPSFVGVDQLDHYNANVEAYKQAAPIIKAEKEKLEAWRKDLAQRKFSVLSAQLKAFDQKVEAYRAGSMEWGAYVKYLSERSEVISTDVEMFLAALEMESKLDFKRVEGQRTDLIAKLVAKMDKVQTQDLVNHSLAYRSDSIGHADFYDYLKSLCRKNDVELSNYPAMDSYIRYAILSDSINVERIFADVTAMEAAQYGQLARSFEEKALVAEGKKLYLTGKLLDFALTKDEWQEYKQVVLSNQFSVLSENLRTNSLRTENFEKFYEEAEIRDRKMAENLIASFPQVSGGNPVAVLVTGGFHSSGIDSLLNAAGYTTITFTPKISKIDENGSGYLGVFTQEKTPLDKLFAGEKLFVTPKVMPAFGPTEVALAGATMIEKPSLNPEDVVARLPDLPAGTKINRDGTKVNVVTPEGTYEVKPVKTPAKIAVKFKTSWRSKVAKTVTAVSVLLTASIASAGEAGSQMGTDLLAMAGSSTSGGSFLPIFSVGIGFIGLAMMVNYMSALSRSDRKVLFGFLNDGLIRVINGDVYRLHVETRKSFWNPGYSLHIRKNNLPVDWAVIEVSGRPGMVRFHSPSIDLQPIWVLYKILEADPRFGIRSDNSPTIEGGKDLLVAVLPEGYSGGLPSTKLIGYFTAGLAGMAALFGAPSVGAAAETGAQMGSDLLAMVGNSDPLNGWGALFTLAGAALIGAVVQSKSTNRALKKTADIFFKEVFNVEQMPGGYEVVEFSLDEKTAEAGGLDRLVKYKMKIGKIVDGQFHDEYRWELSDGTWHPMSGLIRIENGVVSVITVYSTWHNFFLGLIRMSPFKRSIRQHRIGETNRLNFDVTRVLGFLAAGLAGMTALFGAPSVGAASEGVGPLATQSGIVDMIGFIGAGILLTLVAVYISSQVTRAWHARMNWTFMPYFIPSKKDIPSSDDSEGTALLSAAEVEAIAPQLFKSIASSRRIYGKPFIPSVEILPWFAGLTEVKPEASDDVSNAKMVASYLEEDESEERQAEPGFFYGGKFYRVQRDSAGSLGFSYSVFTPENPDQPVYIRIEKESLADSPAMVTASDPRFLRVLSGYLANQDLIGETILKVDAGVPVLEVKMSFESALPVRSREEIQSARAYPLFIAWPLSLLKKAIFFVKITLKIVFNIKMIATVSAGLAGMAALFGAPNVGAAAEAGAQMRSDLLATVSNSGAGSLLGWGGAALIGLAALGLALQRKSNSQISIEELMFDYLCPSAGPGSDWEIGATTRGGAFDHGHDRYTTAAYLLSEGNWKRWILYIYKDGVELASFYVMQLENKTSWKIEGKTGDILAGSNVLRRQLKTTERIKVKSLDPMTDTWTVVVQPPTDEPQQGTSVVAKLILFFALIPALFASANNATANEAPRPAAVVQTVQTQVAPQLDQKAPALEVREIDQNIKQRANGSLNVAHMITPIFDTPSQKATKAFEGAYTKAIETQDGEVSSTAGDALEDGFKTDDQVAAVIFVNTEADLATVEKAAKAAEKDHDAVVVVVSNQAEESVAKEADAKVDALDERVAITAVHEDAGVTSAKFEDLFAEAAHLMPAQHNEGREVLTNLSKDKTSGIKVMVAGISNVAYSASEALLNIMISIVITAGVAISIRMRNVLLAAKMA